MSARRLVVAGGGVAGIAAALAAARTGGRVTLCEAGARLGGRAFSFVARGLEGAEVENGPHAAIGAYAHFRGLLRELGTEKLFARARTFRLAVATPGGMHSFRAWPGLPGPLGLLGGLLGFGPLTPKEKWRTARALASLIYGPRPAEEPVGEWLSRKGLQGAPADTLIVPLCRAVLNTHQEVASLSLLAAAFRGSFRGRAADSALWLPAVPWGLILDRPARERMAAAGVDVRLRARVEALTLEAGRVTGVRLVGGQELACEALVWAVPPWQGKGVLPDGLVPSGLIAAPMGTLHVRVGANLPWNEPVLALGPGQAFDFAVAGPKGSDLVSLIVAGRAGPPPGGRARMASQAQAALGVPVAQALWVPLAAATLHQPAGCEPLRPGPRTGVAGLFLAGDWTATGLPATLEGAALSGRRAAAEFLVENGTFRGEENPAEAARW